MNIIDQLKEWDSLYYNEGESPVSDVIYDSTKELAKKGYPSDPYFREIGSQVKGKIKHSIKMLSMNKAKKIEDVDEWIKKIKIDYNDLLIESKIDGLSCSIVYEKGFLKYMSTRGNGEIGQDITHIKDFIKIKDRFKNKSFEVRGELYLPKNTTFENTENKPLRNLAVGLVNRKELREDLKYLNFTAYQFYSDEYDFNTEIDKLNFLKEIGFDVVSNYKISNRQSLINYFNDYLTKFRKEWEYETDGLILTVNDCKKHDEINSSFVVDHHNHFNIALKPPSESKITELKNIEWNISRFGNIIPVAIFDSINIGGSIITKASMYNYAYVKELKFSKGDKLLVSRSNDVIPYIEEIVEKKKDNYFDIDKCPFCNSTLNKRGVHVFCSNDNCEERKILQILHWITLSEMDQFSEQTIRLLFNEKKINSVKDLYSLKEDDLSGLSGIADKKIANILFQIQKSKTMDIVQFISRLGIPLVGIKAVKKLKIHSVIDFFNFNDSTFVIGRNLIEYRKENYDFLNELISCVEISNIQLKDTKGKICMTGSGPKPRKELEKEAEQMGYEVQSSVNKFTNILICEDPSSNSRKIENAIKFGIKVVSYNEFFKNKV